MRILWIIPSFGAKRIMRNWCVMIGIAALVSCGIEEVSRRPEENREDIWIRPEMNSGDGSREVCYVTAFDYPDDYDWRADREKGSVKCSLTVFADGVPMMKVPVGDMYEVSSDPDMHRMIDGHLYTDYSTDCETVIKKDGKTVLRYTGREMICGMLVEGDTLYTLGHPRQGEGFTFRKNGKTVLARPAGRTFGRLHRDNGNICFAFTEPVLSEDGDMERYHHYSDGNIVQTAVRDDIKKVWDIYSYKGEICWAASLTGIDRPVLFKDGTLNSMIMFDGYSPLTLSILEGEDVLYLEGILTSPDLALVSAFWDSPGHIMSPEDGYVASSRCISGDGMSLVFNPVYGSGKGLIFRCGEEMAMPAGYSVMGLSCAAVADGILHIGLSSQEGGRPMIWKDGQTVFLDISGYIASVSVY